MGLLLTCTRKRKVNIVQNNPNLQVFFKNTIIITVAGRGHMYPASLYWGLIKLVGILF